MIAPRLRGDAPTRLAPDEAALEKMRLDALLDRLAGLAELRGDRLYSDRAIGYRGEVAAIQIGEPERVHAEFVQRRDGQGTVDGTGTAAQAEAILWSEGAVHGRV